MEFGVHLPLIDFGGNPQSIDHLRSYVRRAEQLGFTTVAANDHLWFPGAWLDGLVALSSIIGDSGDMRLATTVGLPVVRGPVPFAKAIAAIDRLSGGRTVVAVGPGSLSIDYDLVGLDFDERWKRLDDVVPALRALWRGDQSFTGRYYSTAGVELLPTPAQPDGPPIWIGSWGSDVGLRRVARIADGWLASAYNISATDFSSAWERVRSMRDDGAPLLTNALGTMWFHVGDTAQEADEVFRTRLLPLQHTPEATLRERLLFGEPAELAEKVHALAEAGVQNIFLWPVTDEERQIERFCEHVRSRLPS